MNPLHLFIINSSKLYDGKRTIKEMFTFLNPWISLSSEIYHEERSTLWNQTHNLLVSFERCSHHNSRDEEVGDAVVDRRSTDGQRPHNTMVDRR